MPGPRLVKDIFPGLKFLDEPNNSNPELLTAVGDTLYFVATDGTGGRELWKSDGSKAGTRRVADLQPGKTSHLSNPVPLSSDPFGLIEFAGSLYFSADTRTPDLFGQRREIWRSDGTSSGTARITDAFPDGGGLLEGAEGIRDIETKLEIVRTKKFLYFSSAQQPDVQTPYYIVDIWRSDGTAAGTERLSVIDIPNLVTLPNFGFFSSVRPSDLTPVGETLFFSALDGLGRELWKTNGTLSGTVRVADLRPGAFDPRSNPLRDISSNPEQLTALGNTLFFTADDGARGRELWKSDGTAAGTIRVKDIRFGVFGSEPDQLTVVGNILYFTADDGISGRELWRSDGTEAGTFRVADIASGGRSSEPINLTAVGNTLFFSANAGIFNAGRELWKSDGTTSGTVLVADIRNPGRTDFGGSDPGNLTVVGNTLYFTAYNDSTGEELWKSDGSTDGTVLVADIAPGGDYSSPSSLTVVGNRLFFSADDGKKDIGSTGRELWVLDLPPTTSQLSITTRQADQSEGRSGITPFTFSINRSGPLSEAASVSWRVEGTGVTAADRVDFSGGSLPSGSVSFVPGQQSTLITVSVRSDLRQEANESFLVSLSNPSPGTTISTASATGIIRNDDLIGTSRPDTLTGTARSEFINGLEGKDNLTGAGGDDAFGFQFGQSSISSPDRILDFRFGADRIDLFRADGAPNGAPGSLTRTRNNATATTRAELVAAVFTDANGLAAGNQALAANAAALVVATSPAIAGAYLIVNDGNAALNDRADLLIHLTGFSGPFPGLGPIPVNSVFL